MKKSILLLAVGFATISTNAQDLKEADVPVPVKEAMKKLYPTGEIEEWEKEEGNFEAEVEVGDAEFTVTLDPAGNLVETQSEIKITELPKGVSDYVAKIFPGKKMKDATKITDAAGKITFEVKVNKEDYVFDADGNFIKKEEKQKEDKD